MGVKGAEELESGGEFGLANAMCGDKDRLFKPMASLL